MRLKCSIPCTRNSSRDSVPADKAVLSRARFPQLSVQFSVQSEITALAGKTYRPSKKPIVTKSLMNAADLMRQANIKQQNNLK